MIRVDEGFAPREHYSEHFDEWSHRLFAESGHLFAAAGNDPAAFGRLLRNRRPVGSLLRTSPEYLAGGTYQHLFQRNGIHHCLDVAVRSANGPLGILGVFREQDAPPFTTEDVARMSLVYDDIVHAFEARQLVGPFDEIESAVLVVDGRGAGGRLGLRAYGLAAAANAVGESAKVAIQLSFEASRLLRIERALACLQIPPRLREVALWLYRGEDAKARLGVTQETFKSYRKELYVRLEVSSVEGLRQRLDQAASTSRLDLERQRPRPAIVPPSGG